MTLWVIVLVLAACGDDEELSPKAGSASTTAGVTPDVLTAEPPATPAADPGVATPLATLSAHEALSLTHAGLTAAIDDLRQRAGGDLSEVQILRANKVTWRDSSLGCSEPDALYAQVLTPGFWFVLS